MSYKEYFIYNANITATAGTGSSFDESVIRMDSDADFEFHKTSYTATDDRVRLRYKDDAIGRYLTKNPVDIKSIAGRNVLPIGNSNSFLPYLWPKPYTIPAGSNFSIDAADYSGATNTLRIAFHGAKYRPGTAPWDRQFRAKIPAIYSISGGFVNVTASSTAVTTIEIDMDAHFLIQKITGIRTGEALISVTEGSTGRDWSNVAVHIDNIIGNGSFPNILLAPRFMPKGSVLSLSIQDLSGLANRIEFNISGVKLYE